MRVLFALMLAAFAFQEPDEFDRALKALSDNSIEVRDKAQTTLAALGEKVLPRLRKALDGADADVKVRLGALIGEIERAQSERETDKANRVKVLGTAPREAKENEAAIEGAFFSFHATKFETGLVVQVDRELWKRVTVDFDVVAALDGSGKELEVERCGVCSPWLVLVKNTESAKLKVKGTRWWGSDYKCEWKNLHNGMGRRIGEFVVSLRWPDIEVTHPRGVPAAAMWSCGTNFEFKLKPGVDPAEGGGARFGGRAVVKRPSGQTGWCRCPKGPQPVVKRAPDLRTKHEITSRESTDTFDLDEIESIEFTFSKQIDEPYEVTGPAVSAK